MSMSLRTYSKAIFGFDAVVNRVGGDAWSNQSPCAKWTAADVLAHNIGMNDMVSGFCAGVDARGPSHDLPIDPVHAWQKSLDRMMSALDEKGTLQTVVKTPWGQMSVDSFLGFAWVDPLVHTWDLAKATGQVPVLDAQLVERGTKQLVKAGDSLRGENMFGPLIEAGSGASAIDTFVGVTGRDPNFG